MLFTVVIPVYNRASVVGAAINSVLAQELQDFEIVVVDDGSSDAIAEVIARYADPRICLVHQSNRGASAARNHGIDRARGSYVAFLDSDDVFLPHHLRTMSEILTPGVIAYAPVHADRGSGYIVKPPRAIGACEAMADYLMCGRGFVQTSGLVVPREAAAKVRYREDVTFGDDTDFAVRLSLAGYRFVMAPKPGVIWFDGPDPARLSSATLTTRRIQWLEDLRPRISAAAYAGYRGWHLAKDVFAENPVRALGLYAKAIAHGAYGPALALQVLAQIVVPQRLYRNWADAVVEWRMRQRSVV